MMSLTHVAIAASTTAFLISTSPQALAMASLGALLPDLDTTESYLGKLLYPIAHWIEQRYPHRTITHCLYFTMALGAIAALLWYLGILPADVAKALPVGHLCSCVADCFTKQGVQLFYPRRVWAVCGKNPNARLTTGSTAEYWVLAVFLCLLVVATNFQEGNLKSSVSQLLGNNNSVQLILNSKGKDHLIYAHVQGVKASDRAPVDTKFLVVEQIGQEFLLQGKDGLYLTGKDLIVERITAEADKRATVKISQLTIKDEGIAAKLFPFDGELVYLTGEISIELGEDLILTKPVGKFHSIERTGNNFKLQSAPLTEVYKLFYQEFGSGQLTIKSLEAQ